MQIIGFNQGGFLRRGLPSYLHWATRGTAGNGFVKQPLPPMLPRWNTLGVLILQVPDGAALTDGDRFELDDGFGDRKVFEWEDTGVGDGIDPGSDVLLGFNGASMAVTLASEIAGKINLEFFVDHDDWHASAMNFNDTVHIFTHFAGPTPELVSTTGFAWVSTERRRARSFGSFLSTANRAFITRQPIVAGAAPADLRNWVGAFPGRWGPRRFVWPTPPRRFKVAGE